MHTGRKDQAGNPGLMLIYERSIKLGREPINLQGRRYARARYASIADVLLHSSATTLCANMRHWSLTEVAAQTEAAPFG